MLSHDIHSVADSQHGASNAQHFGRDIRRISLVETGWAAGKDDAARPHRTNLLEREIERMNLAINLRLADTAGDQLRVLAAEVENQDHETTFKNYTGAPPRRETHRPQLSTTARQPASTPGPLTRHFSEYFCHHRALCRLQCRLKDCAGGSPRIAIQGSNNTITCGYFGTPVSSGSCFYGWENLNFVTDTVAGWDTACNGNPTLTWSQMQAAFGSQTATEIDLIEDGGWNTPRGRDI